MKVLFWSIFSRFSCVYLDKIHMGEYNEKNVTIIIIIVTIFS